MNQFNVGDRVRVIDPNGFADYTVLRGKVGTVTCTTGDSIATKYCVAFDNWTGGHWGNFDVGSGRRDCRWGAASSLELLSEFDPSKFELSFDDIFSAE